MLKLSLVCNSKVSYKDMSNSDNPKKGKVFQQKVLELAKNKFQKSFIEEKVVKMGNPEKEHRFDCVASDSSVIIECKCYS